MPTAIEQGPLGKNDFIPAQRHSNGSRQRPKSACLPVAWPTERVLRDTVGPGYFYMLPWPLLKQRAASLSTLPEWLSLKINYLALQTLAFASAGNWRVKHLDGKAALCGFVRRDSSRGVLNLGWTHPGGGTHYYRYDNKGSADGVLGTARGERT